MLRKIGDGVANWGEFKAEDPRVGGGEVSREFLLGEENEIRKSVLADRKTPRPNSGNKFHLEGDEILYKLQFENEIDELLYEKALYRFASNLKRMFGEAKTKLADLKDTLIEWKILKPSKSEETYYALVAKANDSMKGMKNAFIDQSVLKLDVNYNALELDKIHCGFVYAINQLRGIAAEITFREESRYSVDGKLSRLLGGYENAGKIGKILKAAVEMVDPEGIARSMRDGHFFYKKDGKIYADCFEIRSCFEAEDGYPWPRNILSPHRVFCGKNALKIKAFISNKCLGQIYDGTYQMVFDDLGKAISDVMPSREDLRNVGFPEDKAERHVSLLQTAIDAMANFSSTRALIAENIKLAQEIKDGGKEEPASKEVAEKLDRIKGSDTEICNALCKANKALIELVDDAIFSF